MNPLEYAKIRSLDDKLAVLDEIKKQASTLGRITRYIDVKELKTVYNPDFSLPGFRQEDVREAYDALNIASLARGDESKEVRSQATAVYALLRVPR
jgi:hypothetical protein